MSLTLHPNTEKKNEDATCPCLSLDLPTIDKPCYACVFRHRTPDVGTMTQWIDVVLSTLALPKFGLPSVFVVSFLSATLLPMGSEPVVFGLIQLNPQLFWPTILVATLGNTLGGAVSWWMGWGTHRIATKINHSAVQLKALVWLERLGPKACLASWLPVIGDPICFVAGWLRMPFWPSVFYMMIGKFLRYLVMTSVLLWMWPKAVAFFTAH